MTTEGSCVQPAIPRFDGHYDNWSMLMENFLRSKELWGLVEIGYEESASGSEMAEAQRKKHEELKLEDLKVNIFLFHAIDRTILDIDMCGDRSLFWNLDESFNLSVSLGNNSKMDVTEKGNVKLMINNVKHTITEVFYVPEFKNNLLSIGQLQERVMPQQQHEEYFHTSSLNLSQLWHRRYGHLSYKGLRTLQRKKMVLVFELAFSDGLCKDFIVGKHHNDPIPQNIS